MKIGIIIGSTRPGRLGAQVGRWVHENAVSRGDADYELLDLDDYDLDLLSEPTVPGAANRKYDNPKTRRWSETIDGCDGFVFVSPEYNHGVPAALKNAVDVIYPEWNHKALTLVGYGADGAVRATEQWRTIAANVHLHATRAQLSLSTFSDVSTVGEEQKFIPDDRRTGELSAALDELVALAGAVRTLR